MHRFNVYLLVLTACCLTAACTVTPDAEELPEDEALVETIEAEDGDEASAVSEPQIPVERLSLKGVRGGRIRFEVAGTPAAVVEALLDFSGSAAHRSWVKSFEPLADKGKVKRARWRFEGKSGINPVVELGFWVDSENNRQRIRYRLVKKDFGLGAFFGDYVVEPVPGKSGYSMLTERTFIDSGVWIANASYEDIEDGLREDARLLVPWLAARAQTESP